MTDVQVSREARSRQRGASDSIIHFIRRLILGNIITVKIVAL